MKEGRKSFWTTLPGILTGIATIISAVTGLYIAIQKSPESTKTETPVSETTQTLNQFTDGWAIIGKCKQGDFFDLVLMVHGDSPAIGQSYDAVEDFRLVQKRQKKGEDQGQAITLGIVHRGDRVEVLDIYIETPSTRTVPVWARLRAVLHRK